MKTTLNTTLAMQLKNKFLQKMGYLLLLFSGMAFGQIVIQDPTPIGLCDDSSHDGIEIFDLTTKNTEILANNDAGLYSIAYFTSQEDANNNTNPIPNPTAFQTVFTVVYARVWENANPNNYATTSFNLEVIILNLAIPNDLVVFETPYDGLATFDLTIRNAQITNYYPEYYNFAYFLTLIDAQNNVNPITNSTVYNNSSNNQVIYIRVTSIDPTACFGITSFTLHVLDQSLRPVIQTPVPVNLCDTDNNNYEIFDLSTKNQEVLGSNNASLFTIGYYNSLEEAEVSSTELIASGIQGFIPQAVFVRVHDNANVNNYSITNFNINLSLIPVAHTITNLFVYESPFDGFANFNLSNVNTTLIGDQTGFISKFYLTQADAINNVNVISNSTGFLNTVNQQIIWVRVFNPANLSCYQTTSITSFKLIVVDVNDIINIPDVNFKAAIIATGIDTNSDGNIQRFEGLQLTSLNIPYYTNTSNAILSYQGLNNFQNLISFKETANLQNSIDFSGMPNLKTINLLGGYPISLNNFIGTENLETLSVQQIQITNLDLSSLTNLKKLVLDQVSLNNFDFSHNLQLKVLGVPNNNLNQLDVSMLQNLENLSINGNNFQNINLNNNPNLQYLNCSFNQLTILDLLQNTNLKRIECKYNNLNSLNLNNNINLQVLQCDYNNLNSIDISQNINLLAIECSNNTITSMNFSNNHLLSQVNCNSNNISNVILSNNCPFLSSLELSNNNLTEIFIPDSYNVPYPNQFYNTVSLDNNPNLNFITFKSGKSQFLSLHISQDNQLQYICVDDNDVINISSNNQTNAYSIGPYCSFTPGGNFNTITGSLLFDANNNGCDASDLTQPNIRININDGTTQGATFTNYIGNYNFYTPAGSFDLTPDIENPTWFNFSPTTAAIPFADANNNSTTQNFCLSANGTHTDVEVVIEPITPARPGFDAVYKIVYKNKGNQMVSANVSFNYNDAVLDFISATVPPSFQTIGVLNFGFSNLLPFENRSFYITLHVNAPTDTPPVNIGDVLNFTAALLNIGDENPSDNTFIYNQTVVGSYDPNNITCLEGASVPTSQIGSFLHYGVNFENTGNYPAENIVVKTIIDTTKYDINSLQMLNTSNPAYTRITGNVVEFIFNNIELDSGGHGNVLFKIKTLNSLVNGDMVSREADIFFDYNAPVATGMANTTFQTLNNGQFVLDNSIAVAPNPTSSIVNINGSSAIKSVQVYDIQGRLLETKLLEDVNTTINLSDKTNGIYFLKITTENGSKVEKIIKE